MRKVTEKMNEHISKIDGRSESLQEQNIDKLKEIFPEVFEEDKIDFEKLKNLISSRLDDNKEKYNFTWSGKRQAILNSNTPTMATLLPNKEKSKDWDNTKNIYIEGDNLETLKLLQKSYAGKVQVIYIDPPYNTGHDFVYKDNFTDGIDNYLEQTGQVDEEGNALSTNAETNGRFHSDWLSMMYPRLRLARNLLKKDGIIFVSIDDNEVNNLRKIMNEIFGENNFMGQITVVNNPRGRSQDKYIATSSEYLLIYSKNMMPTGRLSVSKTSSDLSKDYQHKDEKGGYRLLELRNTHRDFGKFNRPNLFYSFYVSDNGDVSLVKDSIHNNEVQPIWGDGFEGCWTWGQDKALEKIHQLVAKKVSGNWKIYRKSYADNATKQLKSVWNDKAFYTDKGQSRIFDLFETKEKIFQSPKSVDYIKQIIEMGINKDDGIILDFFSGSGTTAEAVMKLNKENDKNLSYIMIQLPEKTPKDSIAFKYGYNTISEIAEERIRRAGKDLAVKDPGFKVFELAKSNIKSWNSDPDKFAEQLDMLQQFSGNNLEEGRTNDDLVYELLLKQGLELTDNIEKFTIGSVDCYAVNDGDLFIILGNHIDSNSIDKITEHFYSKINNLSVFILEDQGFDDDADKLNSIASLEDTIVKKDNIFTV